MKKYWKVAGALACAIALAGALAGCSSSSSTTEEKTTQAEETTAAVELQVFAANSLEKVLPEVEALYTEANPNVTFADNNTAASGTLVTQLKDAPGTADVLICASKGSMDTAEENGSIDSATRVNMFNNDLVIVAKEGSDLKISSLEDLATNDAITSIAIGDPNVVPAGKYALQSLESAGLVTYDTAEDGTIENIVWADSIADKINAGADKVGTVAKYVSGGEVTVGFIYTSDIYRYDGLTSVFTTAADSHKTIVYPGAVVAGSANADAAADFINFCMTDAKAQSLFQQYGFELAA